MAKGSDWKNMHLRETHVCVFLVDSGGHLRENVYDLPLQPNTGSDAMRVSCPPAVKSPGGKEWREAPRRRLGP